MVIVVQNCFKEDPSLTYRPVIYFLSKYHNFDESVSVGNRLANELLKCKPHRRSFRIESILEQILREYPDGIIIKDFDVLFNPEYKIDLIQIMVSIAKRKPFGVLWPGKIEDGKLYYAEEGYEDYKVFEIQNYDVICVV